jgi:hypothetical protein
MASTTTATTTSAHAAKRIRQAAYWLAPSLFCVLLYWRAFGTWFQADDFNWLRIAAAVHSNRELVHALFAPMAQGTVRVLSENVFYVALFHLFGMNPLPFHLVTFGTQLANLVLLAAITRRISGSELAGFLAPILWVGNSMLAAAVCWIPAFNEVLCGFFLLLGFYFLLRYFDTGGARYYILQWIAFVLGFGALEVMVVYPILALGYALFAARDHLRRVLPLFVPSVLYGLLHIFVIPKAASGPYWLDFSPGALFETFLSYWMRALGPRYLMATGLIDYFWMRLLSAVITAGVLAFLAWQTAKRDWRAACFLSWFVILLAPFLPLRSQVLDYYLTLPALGLAMFGAWAIARTWRTPAAPVAIAVTLLYLSISVTGAVRSSAWYYQRGSRILETVRGVLHVHRHNPGSLILLRGMPDDVFWAGMFNKVFDLYNVSGVYLVPGEEAHLHGPPESQHAVPEFVVQPAMALNALRQKRALVFDIGSGAFTDITASYTAEASAWDPDQLERRVVVGQPYFQNRLGKGWLWAGGNYRWMSKAAELRLPGPQHARQRLYISGYCPAARVADGPVKLSVTLDGIKLGAVTVDVREAPFIYSFALPPNLLTHALVLVHLEVDRTFRVPPDDHDLGLAFKAFEIR